MQDHLPGGNAAGAWRIRCLTEIPGGYERPVLATATDGIGTKLKLALDYDQHEGVGQDLVAMCANDVLVTGAEPFLFLDYYATGRPRRGSRGAGHSGRPPAPAGRRDAPWPAARTAEMPGLYANGDYDMAGFCVGVVERDRIVDGGRVAAGDRLLGLTADGPHSNGFSLIRAVLALQGRRPARRCGGGCWRRRAST